MTCILHGSCVDVAFQGYQAVANETPPFVIIQYVRTVSREKGELLLLSFDVILFCFSGFYNLFMQGFLRWLRIWTLQGFNLT